MATAAVPASPALQAERTALHPWVIAGTVTIATFMEVLDTSIANVALPHIAGSLSVSVDESTWVLTTYLVANAILLPLSGFLSSAFGRKNYYMACVALFTVSSVMCGMATSLPMLLFFRVLQGAGGGGLQPSTQAILLDTFPLERRGMAMAVYTMAVLVAPILGPTLGGWITDNLSWHWIFLINLPAGALSLALNYFVLEDPPYLKAARAARRGQPFRIDFIGLGLMALGLGCLEVVLDKGQEEDWFGSPFIVRLALIAGIALVGFVVWELRSRNPIVNLRLLADHNFGVSALVVFGLFGSVLGSTALLPLLLQSLMGYDATHAGLVMSPAGICTILLLPVIGWLLSRGTDARWIIVTGLLITAGGTWWLSQSNLQIGPWQVVWPWSLRMMGSGMMFVPLNVVAYATIPPEQRTNATGLFNLLRNEGGGVGTSLATTLQARRQQFHLARLGEHVNAFNPNVTETTQQLTQYFQGLTGDPVQSQQMAWKLIDTIRQQQAAALAYFDCFWLFSMLALALIPLIFLLKRAKAEKGAALAE